MRQRKIRGHKRRHRHIELWRLENLELRFDLIEKYNCDHIDIVVHPWCDLSLINSKIPQPKGKTRRLMLNALADIYSSWKKQLAQLKQPYYLKMWLFDPRFSKSQIVCAVGDKIKYYNHIFFKPDHIKNSGLNNFSTISQIPGPLQWDKYLDEDYVDNNDLGEPKQYLTPTDYLETKNWFTKMLKKPHRKTKINETHDLYSFKRGDVWVIGNDEN